MSDELLRQALGYRRFAGPPRVLVFDTGYYVVGEVIAAARGLGWQVLPLPTASKGHGEDSFIAQLLTALVQHRPDFLFTVNHLGFDRQGVLAGLLARFQLPIASWFVDHPLPILGVASPNASAYTQLFCLERTALPWLAEQGFPDPVHLPTAAAAACHPARVQRLDGARRAALAAPLSFVGDSWWRKAYLEPAEVVQAARRLRARGPLGPFLAGQRALRAAGGGAGGDEAPGGHEVLQVALAQEASAGRRALAEALGPLGLRVYGDPHWAELVPGLDLRPFADPREEAPAVYADSAVSANVTAPQLPTGVNQRVWDVPGAGGFLLSDARQDLLEVFAEGQEAAVYRSHAEAADQARFYLAHPEERARMAARAHARVEQGQRYPHRLALLYRTMRARFA